MRKDSLTVFSYRTLSLWYTSGQHLKALSILIIKALLCCSVGHWWLFYSFCHFEISGLCYSRLHQISTIELFAKIAALPVYTFHKKFYGRCWKGSKFVSDYSVISKEKQPCTAVTQNSFYENFNKIV